MVQVRSTVYVDAGGGTRQTIIRTAAGGAGIEADVLAVSNAARLDMWESAPGGAVGAPVAAVYEGVADYALLTFTCADGTNATVAVPAPQAGIFLADGQTVDPANAGIVALVAAVVGSLLSASGSAATAYVGGTRRRRRDLYP